MTPDRGLLLSDITAGDTVVLRRVEDGRGLALRLAAMGLFPGVPILVYRNDRTGPVVIGLSGSRVMLGRGMARRIRVAARQEGHRAPAPLPRDSENPAARAS